MKKKVLILIILVILLTGCKTKVELVIDDKFVDETIEIDTYADAEYDLNTIKNGYRRYIPAFSSDVLADSETDHKKKGVSYYKYQLTQLDNGYRATYKYKYNFNKYYDARSIKDGFKSSNVTYDEKSRIFTINTDSSGSIYFDIYPELTSIEITIKTPYQILENNADNCIEGICNWTLTRNNNKNIFIKLNTASSSDINYNEEEEPKEPKEEKTNQKNETKSYLLILVFGGIFGFIIVVLFVNKKYNKRS